MEIKLDLDGAGQHEISTGIGFLDHMLTHLAVHGLFDLNIQATGDLHIDAHHTVEDVALALGQAFDKALADRKGIARIGDCFAPMDETLAHVAIDLSGRPYAVIQADCTRRMWNINLFLLSGRFNHFVATCSSLMRARATTRRKPYSVSGADSHTTDPRRGAYPSTKGTL
jgi:imidazoleglycerol-phosphate dehydratase